MKISAIVPVFNEEKTVADVIDTLMKSTLVDEIICINDGSKDRSLSILVSFGNKIKLINLSKNRGKGYAMALGIQKAKGDIIMFFDADLLNLTATHIEKLLAPFAKHTTRATIGQFTNLDFFSQLFKNLTGQRVYYKDDLVAHVSELKKAGFGAEILLNNLFEKKQIKKVKLPGLDLLLKHEKHSPRVALKGWTKEGIQVLQEMLTQEGLLPRNYHIQFLITRLKESTKKW